MADSGFVVEFSISSAERLRDRVWMVVSTSVSAMVIRIGADLECRRSREKRKCFSYFKEKVEGRNTGGSGIHKAINAICGESGAGLLP